MFIEGQGKGIDLRQEVHVYRSFEDTTIDLRQEVHDYRSFEDTTIDLRQEVHVYSSNHRVSTMCRFAYLDNPA